MISLSEISKTVEPSRIRKMFNLSQGLEDIVSFALGEPDFTASQNVVDAAVKAMAEGKTKYAPNAGIVQLRNAVARHLNQKIGNDYNPDDEIIITTGGMQALFMSMLTILDPGDEVILSNPCWTNYPQQIKMCGGVPKFVNVYEEDEFAFTEENLRNAITGKTKAIVINSPANPTGAVISLACLEKIAAIAIEFDLYVISDEVYKYILYDGLKHSSIASLPGMKERTIIIDSFSKTYAMTGWRVGYAATNSSVIKNMVKYQENVAACVNTPAQYAALEALEGQQEHLHHMLNEYTRRRDLIYEGINAIPGLSCAKPKGTFYSFINIKKTGLSSDDFAMQLLNQERVVTIPGNAFGEAGEGFIRISYATSEALIKEGLLRMQRFVNSLKVH